MINGERIKQAREIRGMTQEDLAVAVDVAQPHISLVEQGARSVSDSVLERIGLATQFPGAFFRQESGPEFPYGSLLYRKQKALSGPEAARLRQTARLVLEAMLVLGRRFKAVPMRLPAVGERPTEAAQLARSELGFSPDTPIINLVNKLEKAGIFIFRLPIEIERYDAFSAWSNEDFPRPVVVLGLTNAGDRQRFTVAHELAHLVMHRSFLGYPSELDRQANAFAEEFLLPEIAMRGELVAPLTLTRLAELKSRWGVSLQALMKRGETLGLISARQNKYMRQKLVKEGWDKDEPVRIPVEAPRLLSQMAEMAFGAPIDSARLAKLLSASPRLLDEILAVNRREAPPASQGRPLASGRGGRVIGGGLPAARALIEQPQRQENPRAKAGSVLAFRK